MPVINLAHERFIAAMKEHPNATRAYQLAYPGTSYASAKVQASRLLKNEYIRQVLSEHRAMLDRQALEEAKEAAVLRLQEFYDRQARFRDIIDGNIVKTKNNNSEPELKPATIEDKLRAAIAAMNHKDAFLARYPWHSSVHKSWENG